VFFVIPCRNVSVTIPISDARSGGGGGGGGGEETALTGLEQRSPRVRDTESRTQNFSGHSQSVTRKRRVGAACGLTHRTLDALRKRRSPAATSASGSRMLRYGHAYEQRADCRASFTPARLSSLAARGPRFSETIKGTVTCV